MDEFDSIEERKKAIFDSMSRKRRELILRKTTYEGWNPFEEPKDPIDIRTDRTKRTSPTLVKEFLEFKSYGREDITSSYGRGLLEMVIGLVNGDDRFLAMYEFSLWYKQLLEKENLNCKLD